MLDEPRILDRALPSSSVEVVEPDHGTLLFGTTFYASDVFAREQEQDRGLQQYEKYSSYWRPALESRSTLPWDVQVLGPRLEQRGVHLEVGQN